MSWNTFWVCLKKIWLWKSLKKKSNLWSWSYLAGIGWKRQDLYGHLYGKQSEIGTSKQLGLEHWKKTLRGCDHHPRTPLPPPTGYDHDHRFNGVFFTPFLNLVLEVIKYSNFHHFFNWVSGGFWSPWIFTSTHHVDLGTLKAIGSL